MLQQRKKFEFGHIIKKIGFFIKKFFFWFILVAILKIVLFDLFFSFANQHYHYREFIKNLSSVDSKLFFHSKRLTVFELWNEVKEQIKKQNALPNASGASIDELDKFTFPQISKKTTGEFEETDKEQMMISFDMLIAQFSSKTIFELFVHNYSWTELIIEFFISPLNFVFIRPGLMFVEGINSPFFRILIQTSLISFFTLIMFWDELILNFIKKKKETIISGNQDNLPELEPETEEDKLKHLQKKMEESLEKQNKKMKEDFKKNFAIALVGFFTLFLSFKTSFIDFDRYRILSSSVPVYFIALFSTFQFLVKQITGSSLEGLLADDNEDKNIISSDTTGSPLKNNSLDDNKIPSFFSSEKIKVFKFLFPLFITFMISLFCQRSLFGFVYYFVLFFWETLAFSFCNVIFKSSSSLVGKNNKRESFKK